MGEGEALILKPKVLTVPLMGEGEVINISFNLLTFDVVPELNKIFKKHINLGIEHEPF